MENNKFGGLILGAIVIVILALIAWAILDTDVDTGSDLSLDGQNTNQPNDSLDNGNTPDNSNDTSQLNPDLNDDGEPAPEGNLFTTTVDGSELSFRYPEMGAAVQTGNTVTVTSDLGESLATITIVTDMDIQSYIDGQENVVLPTTPVVYGNLEGQAYQMEDPLTSVMTEHIVLMLGDMVLADVSFQSETGNQLPAAEITALIESMRY